MSYALIQIVTAEQYDNERYEMVYTAAPIVLLAIPLCTHRGCELLWYGMIVAGAILFITLLLSGQLFSIVRGEGLIGLGKETSSRIHFGKDTITSASMMYQCVLAGVLWLTIYPGKTLKNQFVLVCCVGLMMCGVLTGSKGPLISLVVALMTILLLKRKYSIKWLFLPLVVVLFYFYGMPLLSNYVGALEHLVVGAEDINRQINYEYVLNSPPTLFGNGVGAFSRHAGDIYVHNSILEAYYEMGVIGVGLFILVILSIGRKLFREAKQDHSACFVLAFFVYFFTQSMFSGSIFSDSELWLACVLGCTRFGAFYQGNK
jgi:oligosaccharide repeat unit polymerase